MRRPPRGCSLAFAADGPRRLYHILWSCICRAENRYAATTNKLLCCSTKNKIVINKSWDKAVIPLPFSKMVQIYGEPVYISSEDSIEEKTVLVEERLNKVFEFTDKYYWNKNILNIWNIIRL